MSTFATGSWVSAATDHPITAVASVVLLIGATIAAGFALRWISARTRSLFHQVLATTLVSLAIGAAAAVVLARLMVLDSNELGTVLDVLATTALFATLLVLVASKPLGRDLGRLEQTVRGIEAGDRSARTHVDRSDELGQVGRALDDLNERLEQLERERESFEAERTALFSSVSHDLRTPLAALQVSVEALADGISPDPDRYLRSMKRDVQAISSLVDDLFLLARIEHRELELKPEAFDLAEIADEAIEALAPVAATRRLQLELAADARVPAQGNATAIGRVIRNLLDNAIRHAPEGSTVVVSVSATDGPTVRVVDEGPGFPVDFQAEAFEQFTRADSSRSRNTGGAGLGLAIARGLVEAHGGRIWIEPSAGGEVVFALPAA
jgi:signal transduction histidine kinase